MLLTCVFFYCKFVCVFINVLLISIIKLFNLKKKLISIKKCSKFYKVNLYKYF